MRKLKNVNHKKIILILITGFVLVNQTACMKKENLEQKSSKQINTEQDVSNEIEKEPTVNNIVRELPNIEQKEQDTVKYFENTKEEINEILNSDKVESAKEKAIEKFIVLTDFIFYDKDIHGVYFKDLKDGVKNQILEIYTETDSLIIKKFPNYKENISNKYNTAKEWLNDKYNQAKEKINENMNTETKENLEELKDNVKDTAGSVKDTVQSIYDNTKTKVKTWYENLKSNTKKD